MVVVPRFGDRDHHRQRQRHSAHHKKFQRIVKARGVASFRIDYGDHFVHFAHQIFRRHSLFTGKHFVGVAADRVDLAVMHDHPVRMRLLPAWEGICRKTGMHHSNRRFIVAVLKVKEKASEIAYQKHSFIYDRPARKRYHISIFVALFKKPSCHIQLAVKIQSLFDSLGTADKALLYVWHTFPCLAAQHLGMSRDFSPAQNVKTFFFCDDLEHLFCLIPSQLILRKEKHTDSIISFSAKQNRCLGSYLFEKLVGDLKQYANAVACFAFGVFSCAVLEGLNDGESVLYGFVRSEPLDVHHSADAAVVMFKRLVIQIFRIHSYRPLVVGIISLL